ncbi:7995_t:CDS:2, partial [Cetraspora pellucida]
MNNQYQIPEVRIKNTSLEILKILLDSDSFLRETSQQLLIEKHQKELRQALNEYDWKDEYIYLKSQEYLDHDGRLYTESRQIEILFNILIYLSTYFDDLDFIISSKEPNTLILKFKKGNDKSIDNLFKTDRIIRKCEEIKKNNSEINQEYYDDIYDKLNRSYKYQNLID